MNCNGLEEGPLQSSKALLLLEVGTEVLGRVATVALLVGLELEMSQWPEVGAICSSSQSWTPEIVFFPHLPTAPPSPPLAETNR